MRLDRLSVARGGHIFYRMKKDFSTAPNFAGLYALDKRARRERAYAVAAAFSAAGAALRSVFERALSALTAKVVRHA
jgi:hypothetical protein